MLDNLVLLKEQEGQALLEPNPFGLYDMHGNAAEWTLGRFQSDRKAVRGGSWRDLPTDAHASERFEFRPCQKVFNVGFRVLCEPDDRVGRQMDKGQIIGVSQSVAQ